MEVNKELHILICGGAGYIGSHMAKLLAESGYDLTILDNLSTGHLEAVKWGKFIKADIRNKSALDQIFSDTRYDAVMHFSAKSLVGESINFPDLYYENNFIGSQYLIEAMLNHGVNNFIFSSTAAVYGTPSSNSITEEHETLPINPYGETKLAVEKMLRRFAGKV